MAALRGPLVSQRFNLCPWKHVREVAAMLKAIHAQEDKEAARESWPGSGKASQNEAGKGGGACGEKRGGDLVLHGFSV